MAAGERKATVLVVDDNRDAADMLVTWLLTLGHVARAAYHPREALTLAAEMHPDLAILDISLPEMNGYELAAALRAQHAAAPPRLIAISGYGQGTDRARSTAAGFAAHFVKPVDMRLLEREISLVPTRERH